VLVLGRTDRAVDDAAAPGVVTPVALVVLEQRVRGDAAETLRYFRSQDVGVRVISGDNAVSVGAVAASLGLPNATHPIDARELAEDQEALADRMERSTVFGRVTPAQKRAMVSALQSRSHTVAMTGDGVNDVLALKDADIGVAMGSGSPATRAVAQIVLLDNRFSTLPHVVAEGRRVIGNIERVAKLFLTKTVYSVVLAFAIGLAGLPFPFLPRHLTLIGGLTIGIPAFFLALAPNLERARPGFVARVLRISVPAGAIAAAATTLAYVLARADSGATPLQTRTAAVIALFGVAWWVLAIAARPYVPWRIGLVALMAVSFVVVLFAGLGQRFFALDPSHVSSDLTALGIAAVGAALVELAWWVDGLRRGKDAAPA
jgi:cation-transporting ATPase E